LRKIASTKNGKQQNSNFWKFENQNGRNVEKAFLKDFFSCVFPNLNDVTAKY
jgi:hypothetical protein